MTQPGPPTGSAGPSAHDSGAAKRPAVASGSYVSSPPGGAGGPIRGGRRRAASGAKGGGRRGGGRRRDGSPAASGRPPTASGGTKAGAMVSDRGEGGLRGGEGGGGSGGDDQATPARGPPRRGRVATRRGVTTAVVVRPRQPRAQTPRSAALSQKDRSRVERQARATSRIGARAPEVGPGTRDPAHKKRKTKPLYNRDGGRAAHRAEKRKDGARCQH